MSARPRKTWRGKFPDDKDLPKIVKLPPAAQKRWGGKTLVVPAPREVDTLMRPVPRDRLTTINEFRAALARRHGADVGCPITTGIFAWIAAHADEESLGKKLITPWWRALKLKGAVNPKYPGGVEAQAAHLKSEGHEIEPGKGQKPPRVKDFEKRLFRFSA